MKQPFNMKKCTSCGKIKPLSEFHKCGKNIDGHTYECKVCANNRRFTYSKTISGLILQIYSNQKNSSKNRNHKPPAYSKEELKNWLLIQPNFNKLYNNWVKSGYKKYLTPSCDRKDDKLSYCFDNIRLVVWQENQDKSAYDRKNGIDTRQLKPVLKYDLNEVFLKEYFSISQAGRENKINISHIVEVCKGKARTAGKFIWKYKNEKE